MFFGGEIEPGEEPDEAVRRECLEELGYYLRDPYLLKTIYFDHAGVAYTAHIFVEEYDGSPLTLYEGQGMGWFRPASTSALLMTEIDRSLIVDIGNFIERRVTRLG